MEGPGVPAGTRYYLRTGETAAPLPLAFDVPPTPRAGAELRVWASLSAGALHVSRYE